MARQRERDDAAQQSKDARRVKAPISDAVSNDAPPPWPDEPDEPERLAGGSRVRRACATGDGICGAAVPGSVCGRFLVRSAHCSHGSSPPTTTRVKACDSTRTTDRFARPGVAPEASIAAAVTQLGLGPPPNHGPSWARVAAGEPPATLSRGCTTPASTQLHVNGRHDTEKAAGQPRRGRGIIGGIENATGAGCTK